MAPNHNHTMLLCCGEYPSQQGECETEPALAAYIWKLYQYILQLPVLLTMGFSFANSTKQQPICSINLAYINSFWQLAEDGCLLQINLH